MFAHLTIDDAQIGRRPCISWVSLLQEFLGLARLFQVAERTPIICRFDG
jgi:hypothetical protein